MRITPRFTKPLPKRILLFVGAGVLVCSLLALALLLWSEQKPSPASAGNKLEPFTLVSPDFSDGGRLSTRAEWNQAGCTGKNIAPTLSWNHVPSGTASFVLFVVDYDAPLAGGWHHWVVYNIPGTATSLQGSNPYTEGVNDFGQSGYGGPCPPADGETHHYLFLLYAIHLARVGPAGLRYAQVMSVIQNEVVSATSMIGTFSLPE